MPVEADEVERFHATLRRLVAVTAVSTALAPLADFPRNTYSLPGNFGDLPHALLRRSEHELPGEVWVKTELQLAHDEKGWLTLEFLAWWVRDQSRAGDQIQLRPMALPPTAYVTQLGVTLKFIVDQFVICDPGNQQNALTLLRDRTTSLERSINEYASVLGDMVRNGPPPSASRTRWLIPLLGCGAGAILFGTVFVAGIIQIIAWARP